MTTFIITLILILVAPLIGLVMGLLLRSMLAAARPEVRGQSMAVLLLSALPWLPFAFICLSGPMRMAFLAFIVLLYFTAIASGRLLA